MRIIPALLLSLAIGLAHANPALHGTWSAVVDGAPLVIEFGENANGKVNGQPIRWQTIGAMLLLEQQGAVQSYQWQAKGGKLHVSGGDLDSVVAFTRGTRAVDAARKKEASAPKAAQASGGQELVGKWCNLAQFTANRGGSSRMECFELKADGTYTYSYEGSMSASAPGMHGGTASQSSDAGRWRFDGRRLTARSRNGKVSTYALEKRNHPKNRRDPMICLDGTCYVTFYNKPPW